MLEFMMRF